MTKIYPWHKESWNTLVKHLDNKPNAFLFICKKNTGGLSFVEYFAETLLCENITSDSQACSNCSSCLLFNSNNHPDLYYIYNESRSKIKIDAIKSSMQNIHLSSLRGGLKVILINSAEDLNIQAANSILKLLEEPPKNVIFLLISSSVDKVLPTIVSRCRKFRLFDPTYQDALLYLEQNNIENAEDQLSFNSGSPIFSINNNEIKLKEKLFEFLAKPNVSSLLDISDMINNSKLELELIINWLLKWIIDIVIFYYVNDILYNKKYKNNIINNIKLINILKVFQIYDKLKETYKFSIYNLNCRLQVENLLIEYLEVFKKI